VVGLLLLAGPRGAAAQISLSSDGTEVTRDFNSFNGSGFAPNPSTGQLNSNEFIATGLSDGDLDFGGTGDSGDFARGNSPGGETTGGIYAFDVATDDYSLGVQPTSGDFTSGTFVSQYQNNTGDDLTAFKLAYDIEVLNDADRASSINAAYASGSCGSTPSDSEFTALSSLDFTSPEAADNSPSWNTTAKEIAVSGLSISDGNCLFIRFESDDVSGSGSRDELALNNLSLTPNTPTVQFSGSGGTVNESEGSTTLTVELSNPDNESVDVDVKFNTGSSTAEQSDFTSTFPNSDLSTTISFPSTASDGDIKTVTLDLEQNDGVEGEEDAQFSLQNLSTSGDATIATPSQFDLALEDDVSEHNGDVLITELHPNPGGTDSGREYIELYNATGSDITLSSWTLREQGGDDDDLSGVTVPARGFAVLCEDDDPSSNGGINNCDIDYVNGITLTNSGDEIIIEDDTGSEVDRVDYDGGTNWPDPDGEAMIFAGTTENNIGDNWILATERERGYTQDESGDDGSPGRNGTGQALQPIAEVTGGAGWRMLSAPMDDVSANTLAEVNLVQGVDGHFPSADANLYQWPGGTDNAEDWDATSFNAGDNLTGSDAPSGAAGGFLWYIFDVAETKFTDTPPFTLSVPGAPRTSDVTTDQLSGESAGNSAFHLLGNPYAQSFDLSALNLSGQGFQTTVQVWDPSADSYEAVTQSSTSEDFIGPYQGFFVERASSGSATLTFSANGRRADPIGLKTTEEVPPRIEFRLVGRDGDGAELTRDEALTLYAPEGATAGWDVHDASKLTPISGRYATAAFRDAIDGGTRLRAVASIPSTLPDEGIELPVSLQLQGTDPVETLRLSWPGWTNVPDNWDLALHDAVTDSTIDLRTHSSYAFTLPKSKAQPVPGPRSPMELPEQVRAKAQSDNARFTLAVQPSAIPVDLASLDATLSGEAAELRWTTASETNNAGFHVEHRGPDAEDFASTGFVEGHGTTDQPQQYRFRTGPLDPGRHVFRLRQVDLDGTATRSDTVAVQVRLAEAARVEVAPNPVRSRATVSLRVRTEQDGTVALYDVLGRQVRIVHEGPLAPDRAHTLQVNADGLSSGLYLLRAEGEQFQRTRRITVVR